MRHQASIEGFWLGNFMERKGLLFKLKLVKRITRLILDGTLASEVHGRFGLDEISAAVIAAEQRDRTGKVLLQMGTSS